MHNEWSLETSKQSQEKTKTQSTAVTDPITRLQNKRNWNVPDSFDKWRVRKSTPWLCTKERRDKRKRKKEDQ